MLYFGNIDYLMAIDDNDADDKTSDST